MPIRFPTFNQYDAGEVIRGQQATQQLRITGAKLAKSRELDEIAKNNEDPQAYADALQKAGHHEESFKAQDAVWSKATGERQQSKELVQQLENRSKTVNNQSSYDELVDSLVKMGRLKEGQAPKSYKNGGKDLVKRFLLTASDYYKYEDKERDRISAQRVASAKITAAKLKSDPVFMQKIRQLQEANPGMTEQTATNLELGMFKEHQGPRGRVIIDFTQLVPGTSPDDAPNNAVVGHFKRVSGGGGAEELVPNPNYRELGAPKREKVKEEVDQANPLGLTR